MSDPVSRLNAALEGRYFIERELGEGGMATVYLADDLKHERKVAVKVLKPELAAVVGAERFLAEIKTTANLQHPHILPLHDSGEADGFLFYVMPYIEGESLRERLERERQLPVDEAVRIATDVAEALHTAHERGVVHRDVKPANILMSRGRPLVADFGIALAVSAAGGGRLTETGLSLGTPFYMSPEQASADREPSPASDVYSLGCVLYEMLTGEPPHTGASAQAVLAKILMDEAPAPTRTRPSIPANVDAAIRKALEKLPADRFASAQAFAAALADPGFRHGVEPSQAGAARGQLTPLAMLTSGLAVTFAALAAWVLLRPAPEPVRGVEQFADPFLGGQEHSAFSGNAGFDLSPDGTMLVYRFTAERGQILMVRRWDDLVALPIRESDGGAAPAVSLDGLELAFDKDGEIRVLALGGGPVRTLLEGQSPEWGPDGWVYASTDSGTVRIRSTGGPTETLTRLGEGEAEHYIRDVLPDGRGALLEVRRSEATTEIRTLDLGSGETELLVEGQMPRYTPTGHLLYLSGQTLMAARFDPGRRELLGPPIAVRDGVGAYSLSDDGKLYYAVGQGDVVEGPEIQLVWATPSGTNPVDPTWTFNRGSNPYQSWRLSPDGTTIALRQYTNSGYDIWLKRLDRGAPTRLSFSDAHERTPIWSPGGNRVTFLSDRNGNFDVWEQAADGTGQAELLLDLEEDIANVAWSPDGAWLLLETAGRNSDILAYRPGEEGAPSPLIAGSADEEWPTVSPDGRWIAYVSDESGQYEIYVRPFSDVGGGMWMVSTGPATAPRWAVDGGALFYEGDEQNSPLWRVEVVPGDLFAWETPVPLEWSATGFFGHQFTGTLYDVAPDGRLLMGIVPTESAAFEQEGVEAPSRILVVNFFEELKRVVPVR